MSATTSTPAGGTLLRIHATNLATSPGQWTCPEWSIRAGDAWFLLGGPNTGKSSLLRTLAGLNPLAAGRIEFFGADWSSLSDAASVEYRRRIGVVLGREAGLFHRSTVLENIQLPLRYHGGRSRGEIADRTRRLLVALELEPHAHTPSVKLSPPVARRVLLARALALEPEVMLLDDPGNTLDDWELHRLIRFLRKLHAGHELNDGRPLTVLVTGRSPEGWQQFAGMKWALLHDGRLEVDQQWEQLVATAPELFQHPPVDTPAP